MAWDPNRSDVIGRPGAPDVGKNVLEAAYPISYGCLVPEKLNGVLYAARPVGTADPIALDANRGITPTIVVGQAAGTAAALAAASGVEVREVDLSRLQEVLRAADVVLDVETVKLDTVARSELGKGPLRKGSQERG